MVGGIQTMEAMLNKQQQVVEVNKAGKISLVPFDLKLHGAQSRTIFLDAFGMIPSQLSRDPSPTDGNQIAVFMVNGEEEGLVVYAPVGDKWSIEFIAVRKDSRNKGHGRSIVYLLEQQAKAHNIKSIILTAKNKKNIEIFKRMGFKQNTSISKAADNAFMIKDL